MIAQTTAAIKWNFPLSSSSGPEVVLHWPQKVETVHVKVFDRKRKWKRHQLNPSKINDQAVIRHLKQLYYRNFNIHFTVFYVLVVELFYLNSFISLLPLGRLWHFPHIDCCSSLGGAFNVWLTNSLIGLLNFRKCQQSCGDTQEEYLLPLVAKEDGW